MPIWDVDDLQYHSDTTKIGSSMLKTFLDERRRFERMFVSKTETFDSDALRTGRAFHIMVLTPELETEIVFVDSSKAKTSRHKDFKSFSETLPIGGIPLTKAEYEKVQAMRDAVHSHNIAGPLLSGGVFERGMWTTHEPTGLRIKAKPDHSAVSGEIHHIEDLKQTKAKTMQEFLFEMDKYLYKEQAAFYAHIYEEVVGVFPVFFFIAVSHTALGKVFVVQVKETILRGLPWQNMEQGLFDLAECYKTGDWSDTWEKEVFILG